VTAELQFGVDLGRCNAKLWREVAEAADELGYESLWIPEHLVFPLNIDESPAANAHPVDPRTPVFDVFVALAALAAVTTSVRLGTNVYNIGLRHPFVTARAAATLDVVSNGRVDLGIGASWLAAEWQRVELDFATRGARIDESVEIVRRLWSEPTIEHHGTFFNFDPVVFEPKPVQTSIPIHVGGDSRRALRRVAELGDGWIGMIQDPDTFAAAVTALEGLCEEHARDPARVQRTALVRNPDHSAMRAWTRAGATRLLVAPWSRSVEAIRALDRFAKETALATRAAERRRYGNGA
jgi:probable F420-dependent oxidoreductase